MFCVHFAAWWTHYLDSVSTAEPGHIPLSLLFLELIGDCVKAIRLHVYAAGVLVRYGVDREGSRYPPNCAGPALQWRQQGRVHNGLIWACVLTVR